MWKGIRHTYKRKLSLSIKNQPKHERITRSFSREQTSGNTHYNSITYRYRFLADNQFVVSQRSHKSHEKRIVILAFAIRRVYTRQGRQARAKRRAIREICEICVKIKHLREESLLKHKSLRHIFSAVL